MTRYTSVQDMLERAAGTDIPVAVDLAAVAAHGRTRVRRRRAAVAAAAVAALVAGGVAAGTLHGSNHPQPARPTPTVSAQARSGYGWAPTASSRALQAELARLYPAAFDGLSVASGQLLSGDGRRRGPQLRSTSELSASHNGADTEYVSVSVFHGRPGEQPDPSWSIRMLNCETTACVYNGTLPDGSLVRIRWFTDYPANGQLARGYQIPSLPPSDGNAGCSSAMSSLRLRSRARSRALPCSASR